MEIGIIGAGNIGGNAARRFALSGHSVVLSYSREPHNLDALAPGDWRTGTRRLTGTSGCVPSRHGLGSVADDR